MKKHSYLVAGLALQLLTVVGGLAALADYPVRNSNERDRTKVFSAMLFCIGFSIISLVLFLKHLAVKKEDNAISILLSLVSIAFVFISIAAIVICSFLAFMMWS